MDDEAVAILTPIPVRRGDGWTVYFKPDRAALERRMRQTHGSQYDPVERKVVQGGIPLPMESLPETYGTKEAAMRAAKDFLAT